MFKSACMRQNGWDHVGNERAFRKLDMELCR